jgi:apolipoprotein N-acyltransferase
LNFGQANFNQGNVYTVFEVKSIKFSNVICYESSIPNLLRKFVLNGAQFITIEANDGWLGKSSGPYQHFELAKLRAIENRVPIVRCANTGISGIIDPIGRVKQKVPLDQMKVFIADIIPAQQITFYTQYGDIFAFICVLLTIVFIIRGWITKINQ